MATNLPPGMTHSGRKSGVEIQRRSFGQEEPEQICSITKQITIHVKIENNYKNFLTNEMI